jgi:hypothetical protein
MAQKLTPEMQAFIVRSLACYDIPSVVARELLRRYGCVMKTADIVRYDPTTAAAQQRGLAKKWVDLFHMTRDEFTKGIGRIDVAHRATRLRMLSRAARHYEERESFMAMAELLEQIAKECGDAYTNRRELTGKGGAPLEAPVTINFNALTLEELERLEALAIAAEARGKTTIEIPFTPVES